MKNRVSLTTERRRRRKSATCAPSESLCSVSRRRRRNPGEFDVAPEQSWQICQNCSQREPAYAGGRVENPEKPSSSMGLLPSATNRGSEISDRDHFRPGSAILPRTSRNESG